MQGARGRERKKVGRNSERGATFESSPKRLNCRGKLGNAGDCLPDPALGFRGTFKNSSTIKGTKVHEGEPTAQRSTGLSVHGGRIDRKLNRLPEKSTAEIGIVIQPNVIQVGAVADYREIHIGCGRIEKGEIRVLPVSGGFPFEQLGEG